MIMKTIRSAFFLFSYSLLSCSLAFAGGVGTTAMQSLKIVAAPRVAAMGEAFCGVSGDINSIVSNPGGLDFMESAELAVMQNNWTEGITSQYAAFGLPTGIGTFGLAVNVLTVKDMLKTDGDGNDDGNFDAGETAAGISYGIRLGDSFGVGINAKTLSGKIDKETASGFAGDAGILWYASPEVGIGVAVQNAGGEIKYIKDADPLPMNMKAGVAYSPNDSLLIAVDANSPNDNTMKYNAGVEYILWFGDNIAVPLRAGYRTGLDTGGLSGLAAGAGLIYNNFDVEFAWTPMGEAFGDSVKLGLRLKL